MYISIFDLDFVAHPHNTLLQNNPFWGTASACQKKFGRLNLRKVLFTVAKINLLKLKMNKQTNK